MTNMHVSSRLQSVQARINEACKQANRNAQEVTLLAVSKTKPLENIIEAYQAGQRSFAENYAQEAIEKHQNTPFTDAQWHFIGPIQSNKTRGIAEHCDWVHTIDRLKIAKRLNEQRPTHLTPLNVLIQVNISADPAKAGVKPSQIDLLADQISELPALNLKGIMAITANGLDIETLTNQFKELKKLQSALITRHSSCTELSMGMSKDFELAIACGATMVRVGSEIFGARTLQPTSEKGQ